MSKNFNFLKNHDFSRYSGKWVAIQNNKVLSSSISSSQLIKNVEGKKPQPLFVKIPKKNTSFVLPPSF